MWAQLLSCMGSVVVVVGSRARAQYLWHMGLVACGIFLEQEFNLCPLHCQEDS